MNTDNRLSEMLDACIQQLTDELSNESELFYLPPATLTEAWALIKAYGESSNGSIRALKEAFVSALYTIVVVRKITTEDGEELTISPPPNAIKMALMLCQAESVNLEAELDSNIGTSMDDLIQFMEESGRSTSKLKRS